MENLKVLAEEYLRCPITDDDMAEAQVHAERKLDWIISREGDAGGERLEPYYLAQLIAEYLRGKALTHYCNLMNGLNSVAQEVAATMEKECPVATEALSRIQPYCSTLLAGNQ